MAQGERHVFDCRDGEDLGTDLKDLCFIKDRQLILCSCSHEKSCYMSRQLYAALPEDMKTK